MDFLPYFQSRIGLEIGGPSNIFGNRGGMRLCIPVYSAAERVDNCNFSNHTVWEGSISTGDAFLFNSKKAPGNQYISDSFDLHFIKDAYYDFILSSHCIEHLANPLRDLTEWIRLLKINGIFALVIPHKDGTFDHRRPVTSLDHLVQDFENQTNEGDMTHLEEVLKFHDLTKDLGSDNFQSFLERSKQNIKNRCMHHHVFDTSLAIDIVNHLGLQLLEVELFLPYNIVLIVKKVDSNYSANCNDYVGTYDELLASSPFPTDRLNYQDICLSTRVRP